jgi:serpin B
MKILACCLTGLLVLIAPAAGAEKAESRGNPDAAEAVRGNTAFALDLYGRLRGREGNLFLSPESISTALAMTYAGARGRTAEEMAATLHFTLSPERLHPAMAALLRDLGGRTGQGGYSLSLANALWAQRGHPFLPEFLRLARDRYSAGVRELDFVNATEEARQTINDWVARQTKDKIRDLIAKGVLDASTRLVLTNAIYFKGDWTRPFPKEGTHDAPFHSGAGRDVKVPLMSQTAELGYLDGGTFQALELPYGSGDLSMVVFLPRKADGLADFERKLTPESLAGWLAKLHTQEVEVSLPRFRVTAEFSLKDTLTAMGMPLAFSGSADFSGMDGSRDLHISAVVHKAYVDVNERGTEAAAATAVAVATAAPLVTHVFRADHPFLFLIRDRRTGSLLFLGRLTNPRA